jgi:hypothetical protein
LNDESFDFSNRIAEPDTKIQKESAKIKIDFSDLFGVGGTGWQVSLCFFFYTAVPFFFVFGKRFL